MKIAIMGTRGIPANYGGFETFAEELSVRLATRGHDITVYCRSNNIKIKDRKFRGVKLVVLPTISHKYFDTPVHTFLSAWHGALRQRFDVVLICNGANMIFAWIPRLTGAKTVVNVDGIERKRKKWNRPAKALYLFSERLVGIACNAFVTDAEVIRSYYLSSYGRDSIMIPYGAYVGRQTIGAEIIRSHGLEPGRYILYVSRLEPENNALMVIKAFEKTQTDMSLAVVGDAPYANDYIKELKKTRDPRIKFLGGVYGENYRALQQNAYCYIQATEVGGTHPALLEALGFGNLVLAYERPEHYEVGGDAALYFASTEALTKMIQQVIAKPWLVKEYGDKAMARIAEKYSWDRVTDQYEALFSSLTTGKSPQRTEDKQPINV